MPELEMDRQDREFGLYRVGFTIDMGGGDYEDHDPGFLVYAESFEEALMLIRDEFSSQLARNWSIRYIKLRGYSNIIVSHHAIITNHPKE